MGARNAAHICGAWLARHWLTMLSHALGRTVPPTVIFRFTTAAEIANFLQFDKEAPPQLRGGDTDNRQHRGGGRIDVFVHGAGLQLPGTGRGAVVGLGAVALVTGCARNLLTEVPAARWALANRRPSC